MLLARMNAVVSLPPLPKSGDFAVFGFAYETCNDGYGTFFDKWQDAFSDVFFAFFENGVSILE